MQRLDYICGAISTKERSTWPKLGLAVTRRVLRTLVKRYNDTRTKCLVCFVCGEQRTTLTGFEHPNFEDEINHFSGRREIEFFDTQYFNNVELRQPGSLLNNCSYALWYERYVQQDVNTAAAMKSSRCKGKRTGTVPLLHQLPFDGPKEPQTWNHISDWTLRVPLQRKHVVLFGCTEDVRCTNEARQSQHDKELSEKPFFCRTLCPHCKVPICFRCSTGLEAFKAESQTSTIPMSLANDNYYGYVKWILATRRVTWLERACASLCWSTIIVYYLEEPYGNLMLDDTLGAEARTQVRGNLFSFAMPWEDIEENCAALMQTQSRTSQKDKREIDMMWKKHSRVPHDEATLASLLNVHIVGGTKDLAKHLEGATIRPAVVEELIGDERWKLAV